MREIDLTIDRGEFLAVMGASGSGKWTLMNILGCLDQPTRGRYLLDGMDVGTAKQDVLAEIRNRHIGFVFQSFNLIPRTSALENAQLPLFYRGVSLREQRKQAATALQRVGLAGREQHYPSPNFPEASSNAWPLQEPWPGLLLFCSPTNPPATSILCRAGKLWIS